MTILYVSTAFGNGLFEELLWRGVYMELFPHSIPLRFVVPTIAFALWHYAPGAASANENVWGLIIGAAALGVVQSLLAKQTDSVWWPIVAHTIGGLIMVL
jgi:membrane protease YdiL (CAAX protease family)